MDLENQEQLDNGQDSGVDKQPENDILSQKITLPTGEEITVAEARDGHMRQSDYTKKTQELAKQKKREEESSTPEDLSESDKEAMDILKKHFVTIEDIKILKQEQIEKEQFNDFKINNPGLTDKQLMGIKNLKKSEPDKDFHTIAYENGILNDVQLQNAKGNGQIKGKNIGIRETKKEELKNLPGFNPEFASMASKYL